MDLLSLPCTSTHRKRRGYGIPLSSYHGDSNTLSPFDSVKSLLMRLYLGAESALRSLTRVPVILEMTVSIEIMYVELKHHSPYSHLLPV